MNKQQIGGLLLVAGSFIGLLLIAIMEAIYPGYSVSLNFVSDLGAIGTPTMWIFTGMMCIEGGSAVIGAFLTKDILGQTVERLVILTGLGTIGIGLAPDNFMPIAAGHAGQFGSTGVFHVLFAMVSITSGIVVMFYAGGRFTSPFSYVSEGFGVFTLLGIMLMIADVGGIGRGGLERLMIYPLIFWNALLGVALMEVHPKFMIRRKREDERF